MSNLHFDILEYRVDRIKLHVTRPETGVTPSQRCNGTLGVRGQRASMGLGLLGKKRSCRRPIDTYVDTILPHLNNLHIYPVLSMHLADSDGAPVTLNLQYKRARPGPCMNCSVIKDLLFTPPTAGTTHEAIGRLSRRRTCLSKLKEKGVRYQEERASFSDVPRPHTSDTRHLETMQTSKKQMDSSLVWTHAVVTARRECLQNQEISCDF
ncbi:uncharacterized protein BDZ83DRAFT_292478 [Colletotrichum acutatum]|uniref:Uncharacterized protein n=1 Tax=Glomerella acutata TaxID=27357 RepID=A0AAD8XPE0_GLOAC|nr:uncharacterized protein BDZ83DRAFT_292478 [Colletotrichum acutatum]KAK1730998.1 hypothetical protein BDZ83DRAFT_292478 [Colletotrichum acutatum]